MSIAELAERIRGWLADDGYRAVLFERDRLPVAYALFRTEPDTSVHLRRFFVARDHRRQGLDSRVVDTLFGAVFPAGVRATLDVLAHNDQGASFWAAAGFQPYSLLPGALQHTTFGGTGEQNRARLTAQKGSSTGSPRHVQ